MADEKNTPASAPNENAQKGPKAWTYVGPKPAPLISNLPLDLKQPRLGSVQTKYPADELPDKYVEYVMSTNKATKGWWK